MIELMDQAVRISTFLNTCVKHDLYNIAALVAFIQTDHEDKKFFMDLLKSNRDNFLDIAGLAFGDISFDDIMRLECAEC